MNKIKATRPWECINRIISIYKTYTRWCYDGRNSVCSSVTGEGHRADIIGQREGRHGIRRSVGFQLNLDQKGQLRVGVHSLGRRNSAAFNNSVPF